MANKYLARFWVDVEIMAENQEEAKSIARKVQRNVGLEEGFVYTGPVEEYDVQFERFLKINDEYVPKGR